VRMSIKQGLQQFGHLAAAFVAPGDHYCLTRIPIDCAEPIVARGLHRRCNHHLLAFGTPHGTQGRQPADIELVGVVEDFAGPYAGAGVFDRLFLSAYSGSGLVILCCGRLSAMSAARSSRNTLGTLMRRPVCSAI